MRILTVVEVVYLHHAVVSQSGGSLGIRATSSLEGALLQPFLTYEGEDLYPFLVEKAVSLVARAHSHILPLSVQRYMRLIAGEEDEYD